MLGTWGVNPPISKQRLEYLKPEGAALQNLSQIMSPPVIYAIFLTYNYMQIYFISQYYWACDINHVWPTSMYITPKSTQFGKCKWLRINALISVMFTIRWQLMCINKLGKGVNVKLLLYYIWGYRLLYTEGTLLSYMLLWGQLWHI